MKTNILHRNIWFHPKFNSSQVFSSKFWEMWRRRTALIQAVLRNLFIHTFLTRGHENVFK